ncbi:hypothetical protein GE09DRAFT_1215916 [Coniochaeta sp. 2T2.1]|nr:hypothetical protein GE09DRAFT_1215916 [Coniochaeta sp. 2T2.1]
MPSLAGAAATARFDESRRCKSFGVSCTYDRISSELQPFDEAAFSVHLPTVSLNQTVLGLLNDNLREARQLDGVDLALLNVFHERSALTLGVDSTRHIYQREGLRLAIQVSLALTMMHSRSDDLFSRQTAREAHHWYMGASQYNRKLTDPNLTSSERDAIWMTAAMLGCTTLAHVDAMDPELSWPLKKPDHTDLQWLSLSHGKNEAWVIANVSRADSSLRAFAKGLAVDDFVIKTTDEEALKALPEEMTLLCSSPEYHNAVAMLGRLLPVKSCQDNILKFFALLGHMTSEFQQLLRQREPRAVLIMLWYQTLLGAGNDVQWYTRKRTMVETEAMICYLERYHSHVPGMDKLLDFPKRARWARGPVSSMATFPGERHPLGINDASISWQCRLSHGARYSA